MSLGIELAERGWLSDSIVRFGIRRLCAQRAELAQAEQDRQSLVEELSQSELAVATDDANRQHYEVPAAFFQAALGGRLKYSCGLWDDTVTTLDASEELALKTTCERAQLADGMRVLDLGCGWGSLSLWIAEQYPNCKITSVSNSGGQREFIVGQATDRGFADRITVHTADINAWQPTQSFDRVVSVEMFEHVRNHRELLKRISEWLVVDGALFVHIFCHQHLAYLFEIDDGTDWMARHFFTGGMMPSFDWLGSFNEHLHVEEKWWIDGTHYERTSNAWLAKLDANRDGLMPTLEQTYGKGEADRWYHRWRIFFMSCAELFGLNDGAEWGVGHYLLRK